tara:strand:+ start:1373 stop:1840 length:468 start_codon:yes stop_codon:yes gene_type:complete
MKPKFKNILKRIVKQTLNEVDGHGIKNEQVTFQACCDSTALNFHSACQQIPNCNCMNNTCVWMNTVHGCSGLGANGMCDSSQWPNHSSWVNSWSQHPIFSSNNPNQPCDFICQRFSLWRNRCQSGQIGTQWANQLSCKLDEVMNQMNIHSCNCSW